MPAISRKKLSQEREEGWSAPWGGSRRQSFWLALNDRVRGPRPRLHESRR
jgi:hypothetical protein